MRRFKIRDKEGFSVACRAWETEDMAPKAVLQVLHGMAEHSGRYGELAEFFLQRDIATYASDHRGHGFTAEEGGQWGCFADEDGWEKVLSDIGRLNEAIKKRYPGVPVFLLGHSMGSFLARDYMHDHDSAGVILSGSAFKSPWEIRPAKILASVQKTFLGRHAPARLLDRLSFGSFNRSFAPNRTSFDWLNREWKAVDEYVRDPWCGFVCTVGFFDDLLGGLLRINSPEYIGTGLKDVPILMLSGEKDPVGSDGRDLEILYELFGNSGYGDVERISIPGARHEILNETDRHETYETIYRWIKERS